MAVSRNNKCPGTSLPVDGLEEMPPQEIIDPDTGESIGLSEGPRYVRCPVCNRWVTTRGSGLPNGLYLVAMHQPVVKKKEKEDDSH